MKSIEEARSMAEATLFEDHGWTTSSHGAFGPLGPSRAGSGGPNRIVHEMKRKRKMKNRPSMILRNPVITLQVWERCEHSGASSLVTKSSVLAVGGLGDRYIDSRRDQLTVICLAKWTVPTNLRAKASNLLVMASNLRAKASNLY